jgi:hypothetical protein
VQTHGVCTADPKAAGGAISRRVAHRAAVCRQTRRIGSGTANATWLRDPARQCCAGELAWRRRGGDSLRWGTLEGTIYLATRHHDMRKPINGLALAAADTLDLDPVSPHIIIAMVEHVSVYQHDPALFIGVQNAIYRRGEYLHIVRIAEMRQLLISWVFISGAEASGFTIPLFSGACPYAVPYFSANGRCSNTVVLNLSACS